MYYYFDNNDKLKESFLLLSTLDKIDKLSFDEIPEEYLRRDYIIEKIYDKNKSTEF